VQKADLYFDLDQDKCDYVPRYSFLLAASARALKSFRLVIEGGSPLLTTKFGKLAREGMWESDSSWMLQILKEMRRDLVGIEVDVKLMFEFPAGEFGGWDEIKDAS